MNLEYEKLIEECNGKRSNIYYRLNQLGSITGLSPRMLKYKMKLVKEKYQNVPSLLSKEGRSYKIHMSIVNEFLPIRKRNNKTVANYHWKSFATWNMLANYDAAYHQQLIHEIKSELPTYYFHYTIEADGRNFNHVHLVTDANSIELSDTIRLVLGKYLSLKDYRLQVNSINNKYSAVQYLGKSPLNSGVI